MLRRKKKKDAGSPPETAVAEDHLDNPGHQDHDGGPGDAAIAMSEDPPASPVTEEVPAPVAEAATVTEEPPTEAAPTEAGSTDAPVRSEVGPPAAPPPDGDFEERLPASFYFEGVVKPERVPTRDERDRQAEADFRAAIAPSLAALRELVPEASSPDEAMQILADRQGEALVDEEGANLSSRDIYNNETSVYYRIRTHFDKPSRRIGLRRDWKPPSGLASPQRELGSGRRSGR